MIHSVAVIGAGNGGKAAAADLALQGVQVRLFEFPEYHSNIDELAQTRRLTCTGALEGEAELALVTTDLAAAVDGADVLMVCTQALAHDRIARELAPLVRPEQLVVLNPGSTGGSLIVARVFRELGVQQLPVLSEFSTLTYGCRAQATSVNVGVKVAYLTWATLPSSAIDHWGPPLEALFPGLVRVQNVLEAGLNNANPIIHPPVALLNAARFEKQGAQMFFYKDGVSPAVADLIRLLDEERMALQTALGGSPQPDPVTCVVQGYAASEDYLACYSEGPGFMGFRSPDTLDHRYWHEDMGMGLVFYCSLGELLGVPTPVSRAIVAMGSIVTGVDYLAEGAKTLATLGLDGLSASELLAVL